MVNWTGYYINLDRASERRASIEAELERLRVRERYQRLPAHVASDPRVGCYRSHVDALERGRSGGQPGVLVHILEDDALLGPGLSAIVEQLASVIGDYDIIFTNILPIDPGPASLEKLRQSYLEWQATGHHRLIDLKGFRFASADSYFVNPKRIGKVLAALHRSMTPMDAPIDLVYCREVQTGRLSAACLFPFPTGISFTESTIARKESLEALAMLYKHIFYVGHDKTRLCEIVDRLLPADDDLVTKSLLGIHRALITGSYKTTGQLL